MVDLECDELMRPAEAGVRLLARRQLEEAREAASRLADPEDAEAVHDLRVALRRLRSTFAAYRTLLTPDATSDALPRVCRIAARTGATRDAQVALDWLRAERDALRPGERALLTALVESLEGRASVQDIHAGDKIARDLARVERELENPPARDVRSSSLAAAASSALQAAAAELEDALAHVEGDDDVRREHEARIVAKRLRYLLEPVRKLTPDGAALLADLKLLQDLLGERHDRDVLGATLRAALERASIANAQALTAAIRARDSRAERRLRARRLENLLLALLRRLHGQRERIFAEFARNWLAGRSARFFDRVREFNVALRQIDDSNLEIERKYLLRELPERVRSAEAIEIEQGYLPGERVRERLRRATGPRGTQLTRTVKLGSGVMRSEDEDELSAAEFARLWPLTAGARLRKRRHLVPEGELVWEIDEFLDRALVLAEIEIPRADTEVTFPEWLAPVVVREVTDEPAFTNLRLACESSSSS